MSAKKSSTSAKKVEPEVFDTREVVLAKVRGFPPWPGMVSSAPSACSDFLRFSPISGAFLRLLASSGAFTGHLELRYSLGCCGTFLERAASPGGGIGCGGGLHPLAVFALGLYAVDPFFGFLRPPPRYIVILPSPTPTPHTFPTPSPLSRPSSPPAKRKFLFTSLFPFFALLRSLPTLYHRYTFPHTRPTYLPHHLPHLPSLVARRSTKIPFLIPFALFRLFTPTIHVISSLYLPPPPPHVPPAPSPSPPFACRPSLDENSFSNPFRPFSSFCVHYPRYIIVIPSPTPNPCTSHTLSLISRGPSLHLR
ncbi:hypothetical protein K438DRAFT_1973505 [Mycena galopus ATCC 62051]|nr:hypothetical protein K438DRAFT_1973505 [Mycena galopus ATCC 62051]